MKLRLDTPIAKLTVDLPEEQVFEILGIALDYATGFSPEEVPVVKEPPKPTPTPVPVVTSAPAPEEPKKERKYDVPNATEFKGFLYLRCDVCGKFKAFMPKSPISHYKCDCGEKTELKDVRVMKVQCKCGQKFKYLTNAKDDLISIDCLACGSPVDLEYHERKHEYVTIGCE